jgi:hypothetical protein
MHDDKVVVAVFDLCKGLLQRRGMDDLRLLA